MDQEIPKGDDMIKVLLVEDNPDYVSMLLASVAELRPNPFEFIQVELLAEAIQCLKQDQYDVILLDLSLPDSGLFDTFDRIYSQAPNVPIVVMTVLDDKQLALKAVREGAQDYLVKGVLDVNVLARSLQYAVERHRTLTHLKRLSFIDDLTKLLNRRGFLSLAKQHMKIAQRANRELLLLYADLDGLKQINDQFGHHEGDRALKTTSSILRSTFRSSDLIARLGGDEFIVLAVDALEDDAQVMTERLHEGIHKHNLQNSRYQLSISVGLARFDPQIAPSLHELMKQADKALYEEKRRKKETG